VKIIHGEKDVVAPAAEAKELASLIDGAGFCLMPEAAHAVFLDDGFFALVSDD
jgi:pimeloyl-ACP methyl ester carboxylesterase